MGDQKIGADEISFDRKEGASGEETALPEAQPISDQAMQELWLRRVQTKPADFLKAKFAYQLAIGDRQGGERGRRVVREPAEDPPGGAEEAGPGVEPARTQARPSSQRT